MWGNITPEYSNMAKKSPRYCTRGTKRQRKHKDTKQLFAQRFPSLEAHFLGSIRELAQHPSSTKNFEQIGDRWRYGSAFAAMMAGENTLRTRRFQWRLPKDPMIGSRSLRESAIPHDMVLVIIYETTAAYHRALLENSRRTTITTVLKNGGRICGGCNNKQAWVRVNQRA